jgi:hypothetical protein
MSSDFGKEFQKSDSQNEEKAFPSLFSYTYGFLLVLL